MEIAAVGTAASTKTRAPEANRAREGIGAIIKRRNRFAPESV